MFIYNSLDSSPLFLILPVISCSGFRKSHRAKHSTYCNQPLLAYLILLRALSSLECLSSLQPSHKWHGKCGSSLVRLLDEYTKCWIRLNVSHLHPPKKKKKSKMGAKTSLHLILSVHLVSGKPRSNLGSSNTLDLSFKWTLVLTWILQTVLVNYHFLAWSIIL